MSRRSKTTFIPVFSSCLALAALKTCSHVNGSWNEAWSTVAFIPILALFVVLPLSVGTVVKWRRDSLTHKNKFTLIAAVVCIAIAAMSWGASIAAMKVLDESGVNYARIGDDILFARFEKQAKVFDALAARSQEVLAARKKTDGVLLDLAAPLGVRFIRIDLPSRTIYFSVVRDATLSWVRDKGFAYSDNLPNNIVDVDIDSLRIRRSEWPVFRRISDGWYVFVGPN